MVCVKTQTNPSQWLYNGVRGVLTAGSQLYATKIRIACYQPPESSEYKRDSGVIGGSISDKERGTFDLYVALDVLESEVAMDAGVFGAVFGALNQHELS
jgi:hypothetical protein